MCLQLVNVIIINNWYLSNIISSKHFSLDLSPMNNNRYFVAYFCEVYFVRQVLLWYYSGWLLHVFPKTLLEKRSGHLTRWINGEQCTSNDDVIKWKHFPRYWPFVRGIHRSPVNSRHKGQWRGALMFSLICASTNSWANKEDAGDLRRHRSHYDVILM